MESIVSKFVLKGRISQISPLGDGFINDTYIVKTEGSGQNYILQRKNSNVFPDVPAMMDNIVAVTDHIKKKVADPERETLTVVPTVDGKYYYKDETGSYWTVCTYITDSVTYDVAESLEMVRQAGMGIGRFQSLLSDFDKPLHEVIKGFPQHSLEVYAVGRVACQGCCRTQVGFDGRNLLYREPPRGDA